MSSINGLYEQDGQQKYCYSCFFLINQYFLQFSFIRTFPSNVAIVYVTVYKKKINIFPRFLIKQKFGLM